jgi:hypothetical protein
VWQADECKVWKGNFAKPHSVYCCVRNQAGKQLKMNDFLKKLWAGDPPNTCSKAMSLTSVAINAKYY